MNQMKNTKRFLLLAILAVGSIFSLSAQTDNSPGSIVYMNYCSACHGKKLEGGQAPSLLTTKWKHGDSKKAIIQTIKKGVPNTSMMAWENMLNEKQIEQVADYMLSLKKSKKQKS
jgi:cbb3-type cytochrome c oxidase subunit III